METRARYALIGLFMLAVIGAVFAFVYWLENSGGFIDRKSYKVLFDSSVSGLLPGSAVTFNGIRVGEVTGLGVDPAEPRVVVVTIAVAKDTPIRNDTKIGIDVQGLTGGGVVSLRGGNSDSQPIEAAEGDVPVLVAAPSSGQDWTQAARDAFQRIDSVLAENQEALRSAITNIDIFAQALGRNSDKVDGILAGIERLTGGPAAKPKAPIYDLSAVDDFTKLETPPSWQLVVPEPTALMAVNSDKIQSQGADGESVALPDAQWSDNLPVMLQEKVLQSFENAGYAQSVGRPRDGLTAGFQLLIDIRRFAVVTTDQPTAELEFVAKILGSDGKIIAARSFQASAPAAGTDAPAAAKSLNEAFAKAVGELVPWVAETVNSAPPPPAPSPT